MGLILATLTILWLFALWAIFDPAHAGWIHLGAMNGTAFGNAIATGHPLWFALLFVTALFYVVALPIKLLMKNATPWRWSHYSFFSDVMQSIVFLAALYFLVYTGRELFPLVNAAYGIVVTWLRTSHL
jgi:hypothetical protein